MVLWAIIATIWFKWAAAEERSVDRGPVIRVPQA